MLKVYRLLVCHRPLYPVLQPKKPSSKEKNFFQISKPSVSRYKIGNKFRKLSSKEIRYLDFKDYKHKELRETRCTTIIATCLKTCPFDRWPIVDIEFRRQQLSMTI